IGIETILLNSFLFFSCIIKSEELPMSSSSSLFSLLIYQAHKLERITKNKFPLTLSFSDLRKLYQTWANFVICLLVCVYVRRFVSCLFEYKLATCELLTQKVTFPESCHFL